MCRKGKEMYLSKSNRRKVVFLWAIVNIFAAINMHGQHLQSNINLMIGDIAVDSVVMKMGRAQLVAKNKLTTNQKGFSVHEFTYSMFALGSSVREVVKDSMFPIKMKNAILDREINYRYINIESVQLINKNKDVILPQIDTVKIKFLYP